MTINVTLNVTKCRIICLVKHASKLDHGQDGEKNSKKRTHLILQLLPNQIIQRKKGVIPSNHSPIVFGIFRTTKLLFMDNSEISTAK